MENKCILLIGLPGSGKSTYAKKYLMNGDTVYLSSDDLRIEMFGFEDQTHNGEVFDIMNKRCKQALKDGKNVIYDATNINRGRRVNFIKDVCKGFKVDAYLFCCPISVILERNITRTERHLPWDKLEQLITNIDVPMYYEGFEDIYLINGGFVDDIYQHVQLKGQAEYYNQDNPYHKETLLEHIYSLYNYLEHNYIGNMYDRWKVEKAAIYHDYGKLYTRNYNETKGYCTYYNHEKVSAYIWLCHIVMSNSFDELDRVRLSDGNYQVSVLIAHHMDFYKANLENTKNLFNDEDLYNMLLLLHEADKYREE